VVEFLVRKAAVGELLRLEVGEGRLVGRVVAGCVQTISAMAVELVVAAARRDGRGAVAPAASLSASDSSSVIAFAGTEPPDATTARIANASENVEPSP